jgi:hyperosmotically inducible periplasmic protein
MNTYLLIALAGALALTACKAEDSGKPAADNTKMNERDKDGKSVTPLDQSNRQEDLDTTQKIRKALMADDTLSTDAKNLKVVTANGVVVLRGPVKSDAERTAVEALAKQNAGANRVTCEVEVAAK